MPIRKLDLKSFMLVFSPAALARPGEKVWSPKLPLVTASEMRSAWLPKPYRWLHISFTVTSNGPVFIQPCWPLMEPVLYVSNVIELIESAVAAVANVTSPRIRPPSSKSRLVARINDSQF